MYFVPGTFAVAALVTFPIMLHVQLLTQTILLHLIEKSTIAGSHALPAHYLISDIVVGVLSAFAALLVLWPLLPWLPAAFPTTPPTPPSSQTPPLACLDLPLVNRKESVQMLALVAFGVALVGPMISRPFTFHMPKKFM